MYDTSIQECWQLNLNLTSINIWISNVTIKIITHYATLSPFFEDWYCDWKIDNSLGY